MLKLGIIGYPLKHSLSPSMQGEAMVSEGISGEYILLETPPEKLDDRINYIKSNNFKGFNITIPYKVDIMQYLHTVDELARRIGAVNTVLIDEKGLMHGFNTDVYGFVQGIPKEFRENICGKSVAVLGSGGASRAIIGGLIQQKAGEICIFARNLEKAEKLAEDFRDDCEINCLQLTDNIDLARFIMLVNTTPLGMQGKNENISPISIASCETLSKNALVYDIVYRPQKTKLIEYAEKCGLKYVNGVDMLVFQGAMAFEIWTGKTPSITIMRKALLQVI